MSDADRARRYRQRQRKNSNVVGVEIDFDIVDAMIASGILARDRSADKEAISGAAREVLRRWQKVVTRDASSSRAWANFASAFESGNADT